MIVLNRVLLSIVVMVALFSIGHSQEKPSDKNSDARTELAEQLLMAQEIITLKEALAKSNADNAILKNNAFLYEKLVVEYDKQIETYTKIIERKNKLSTLQQEILEIQIEELEKQIEKLKKKRKSFFDFKTTVSIITGIIIGGKIL